MVTEGRWDNMCRTYCTRKSCREYTMTPHYLSYRISSQSEGITTFVALAVVSYVLPFLSSFVYSPHLPCRDVKSAISPCGMCRQFIREFCAFDMPILMIPGDYPQDAKDGSGGVKESSIRLLLPDSFGPEDLEKPRV